MGDPHMATSLSAFGVSVSFPVISWIHAHPQLRCYTGLTSVGWKIVITALVAGVHAKEFNAKSTSYFSVSPFSRDSVVSLVDLAIADHATLDSVLRDLHLEGMSDADDFVRWLRKRGIGSMLSDMLWVALVRCEPSSRAEVASVDLRALKVAAAAGIDIRYTNVNISGWSENDRVSFSKHSKVTMLGLAILLGQYDVAQFLIAHGCEAIDLSQQDLYSASRGAFDVPPSKDQISLVQVAPFFRMLFAKLAYDTASLRIQRLVAYATRNRLHSEVTDRIVAFAMPLSALTVHDFRLPLPPSTLLRISVYARGVLAPTPPEEPIAHSFFSFV
eukprot:TRINITY_DN57244_c0_g1_i1.p1 TRINITY_DN57244_c0_g1~~TRINITY_DN57244_c0_g1_i1.p1  ORF type:complete len:354 (-),score=24.86 TRINITY_DN57244_c0_g1_i1:340-1329(-)